MVTTRSRNSGGGNGGSAHGSENGSIEGAGGSRGVGGAVSRALARLSTGGPTRDRLAGASDGDVGQADREIASEEESVNSGLSQGVTDRQGEADEAVEVRQRRAEPADVLSEVIAGEVVEGAVTEAEELLLGEDEDGGGANEFVLSFKNKKDVAEWIRGRLVEFVARGWRGVDMSALDDKVSAEEWMGALSGFTNHFNNPIHQRGVSVDFLAGMLSALIIGTVRAYKRECRTTAEVGMKWRIVGSRASAFVKSYSGNKTAKRIASSEGYVEFAEKHFTRSKLQKLLRRDEEEHDDDSGALSSDDAEGWTAGEEVESETEGVTTRGQRHRLSDGQGGHRRGRREQGGRRLAAEHLRTQDARIQGLESAMRRLESSSIRSSSGLERMEKLLSAVLERSAERGGRDRAFDDGEGRDGLVGGGGGYDDDDAGVFGVLDRGPRGVSAAVRGGHVISDELAAATSNHQLKQAMGDYGSVLSTVPKLVPAANMRMRQFGVGEELLDVAGARVGLHRHDRFVQLADLAYQEILSGLEQVSKEKKQRVRRHFHEMRRHGAALDSMMGFVEPRGEATLVRWRPFEVVARNFLHSWEVMSGHLTAEQAAEILYSPVSLSRGLLSSAVRDLYIRRAKSAAQDP